MKIELLRNCSHGSEIATYLFTDESGGKRIIKASTTRGGIKNLHKEVDGWRWYQKLRYPGTQQPLCSIVKEYKSYLKIEINYLDGNKPAYQTGFDGNEDAIMRAVQHYCEVWPRSSGELPMHGDLSLDNMIINSDGVHIIDWEHFAPDAAPWGFDMLYMLFESLYFGMYLGKHKHYKPTSKEIHIICEHIKTINACRQLQPDILKAPLKFIKEFILANIHLWGEQLALYQSKLPIIVFSAEQVFMIDEMIGSRMDLR